MRHGPIPKQEHIPLLHPHTSHTSTYKINKSEGLKLRQREVKNFFPKKYAIISSMLYSQWIWGKKFFLIINISLLTKKYY